MLLPFLFFSFYKKEYAKYFCALFIIHAKSMRYKENVGGKDGLVRGKSRKFLAVQGSAGSKGSKGKEAASPQYI